MIYRVHSNEERPDALRAEPFKIPVRFDRLHRRERFYHSILPSLQVYTRTGDSWVLKTPRNRLACRKYSDDPNTGLAHRTKYGRIAQAVRFTAGAEFSIVPSFFLFRSA